MSYLTITQKPRRPAERIFSLEFDDPSLALRSRAAIAKMLNDGTLQLIGPLDDDDTGPIYIYEDESFEPDPDGEPHEVGSYSVIEDVEGDPDDVVYY